jgi:PPOX class probable F420-dependent enzyme
MAIPEAVRALVAKGPYAHLTTLSRKGSPQVSVVWVGIENDEFVMGHMLESTKVKNVKNDSRVALSFLGHDKNPMGLLEYVVVYGKARITEGGAADLLQRLAHVYMSPDVVFPPAPYRNNPGFITRITPTRYAGIGPWAPSQR